MYGKGRMIPCVAIGFIAIIIAILAGSSSIHAQYWAAIPPYNTLWPLWSPVLSPIDPITGLPTPILTELIPDTLLPIHPALTWDPSFAYPWLLYNSTIGLSYWDQVLGFNPWPPAHLFDAGLGVPLPIALTGNWEFFPPTSFAWGAELVPVANAAYPNYLYALDPIGTLLTALKIWGL